MKWLIASIFLALCLADGNVLVLTDETFQDAIDKNPIIMVKFFAPWCGHCKSFAPEYEKAAKVVKEQNLPFVIAELDATEHKVAAEQQGIQGFPTVKLFARGKVIDYDGERTAESVISFIIKNTGPVSTELKTVEEVEALKGTTGLKCIFVPSDNKTMETYLEVAKNDKNYMFFHAEHEIISQLYPEAQKGNVLILKDFDNEVALFQNPLASEDLKSFLITEMLPIVNNMTQKVVEQVFKAGGRTGVILFRADNDPKLTNLEREFARAAKALKAKEFVFITNNKEDEWGARLSDYLGIEGLTLPMILIVKLQDGVNKYIYNGEIVEAKIQDFVKSYVQGTAQIYYKSEAVPTENPGPVYKVVTKTFKREVLDNDNDVIVKFYAPWCGHCKKLAPIYERLAEAMKDNKKVRFVEVDATKNDIEGHLISSFPVIKFFPGKNKSNVLIYGGDRTEQKIAEFMKEKGSHVTVIPEFPVNYYEFVEVDDL